MTVTTQFCCCLPVLLTSEHTSKENGKTETFSFRTGEKKQPQIHSYVFCLNLVWTACTARNLAVFTTFSELEQEQEDKYNTAIYSSIPKKITLL